MIIIRDEQVLINQDFHEGKFPSKLRAEYERLSSGDLIFFYDIEIKGLGDLNHKIAPVNFIIE